jgi:hypothetical protein
VGAGLCYEFSLLHDADDKAAERGAVCLLPGEEAQDSLGPPDARHLVSDVGEAEAPGGSSAHSLASSSRQVGHLASKWFRRDSSASGCSWSTSSLPAECFVTKRPTR